MRKVIIALLTIIVLLSLTSCADEETEQSYSIKDALKISAYVFDETIDENVYDVADTVYTLEQLKLNEIKMMVPLNDSVFEMLSLNIFIEFDGIIEVVSEDEDIELSINNTLTLFDRKGIQSERTYGYTAKFAREGFVGISPLFGELVGMPIPKTYYGVGYVGQDGEVGTERYLNINVYKFDSEQMPVIQARLKLVTLEDKLSEKKDFSIRCYSIELISYEYSDMAKLLDDIVDDEVE